MTPEHVPDHSLRAAQTSPKADTLCAIADWVGSNAPLPAVTGENALKPRDYFLNLKRLMGLHLNGVLFARYVDLSKMMGLGELSNNANSTVKKALAPILTEMDRIDTKVAALARPHRRAPPAPSASALPNPMSPSYRAHRSFWQWVVQCAQRSGDYEAEFDGFHNSNRNAEKGFGTFHTSEIGFCLKIVTTDKRTTAGVAGIPQRHEKVALKLGLAELILRDGYAPDLIGTDACKGAPKDIELVRAPDACPHTAAPRAAPRPRRLAASPSSPH